MTVFECQNCGKTFEEETNFINELLEFCNTETPDCPYCHSGDVIKYEEDEND